MTNSRRGFFQTLAGTGGAAAVLSGLPEPAKAERIALGREEAYVLTYDGNLPGTAYEQLQECWKQALGPNAPKVIILEGGLRLSRMGTLSLSRTGTPKAR